MDTTQITFEVEYALSSKYRDEQFAKTAKRPAKSQTVAVAADKLSEQDRRRLLDLAERKNNNGEHGGDTWRLPLVIPEFKMKSNKRVGWRGVPSGYTSRSDRVTVSGFPEYNEPSKTRVNPPLLELGFELVPDEIGEALDKWEAKKAEIRDEYEEALPEMADRLIEMMEEAPGHVSEDGTLSKPLVLKDSIIDAFEGTDQYDRLQSLQSEAKQTAEAVKSEKERRKKEKRREEQKRRERRREERDDWIDEHGSDLLQDARDEGYDCQRRYALERVQKEHHEDFYLDFDGTHEYKERSCPSEEALRFAQKTGGEVVWLTTPGTQNADEDQSHFNFSEREAVVKSATLGEHGQSYTLIREF